MKSLNDANIHYMINLWCNNKKDAILKYGHISNWDVSNVTNMDYLFQHKHNFNECINNFNECINNWNVSKYK